jgi:hypothetical protein
VRSSTGGKGVGCFNAGKLNAYLHGLKWRLQSQNEGLLADLAHEGRSVGGTADSEAFALEVVELRAEITRCAGGRDAAPRAFQDLLLAFEDALLARERVQADAAQTVRAFAVAQTAEFDAQNRTMTSYSARTGSSRASTVQRPWSPSTTATSRTKRRATTTTPTTRRRNGRRTSTTRSRLVCLCALRSTRPCWRASTHQRAQWL